MSCQTTPTIATLLTRTQRRGHARRHHRFLVDKRQLLRQHLPVLVLRHFTQFTLGHHLSLDGHRRRTGFNLDGQRRSGLRAQE